MTDFNILLGGWTLVGTHSANKESYFITALNITDGCSPLKSQIY